VRRKEVGLSLVLLGIAEMQSKRINKLSGVIRKIESRMFDDKTFVESLSPREALALYKTATDTMDTSIKYVTDVMRSVDWTELENRISLVRTQLESKDDEQGILDMEKEAGKLLSLVARQEQD